MRNIDAGGKAVASLSFVKATERRLSITGGQHSTKVTKFTNPSEQGVELNTRAITISKKNLAGGALRPPPEAVDVAG